MDDFPAAHSMDTTWFAIDKDGHIGVFDSGEEGHVPPSKMTTSDTVDLDGKILSVIGRSAVEKNLAAWVARFPVPAEKHGGRLTAKDSPFALLLMGAGSHREDREAVGAVVVPAGAGLDAVLVSTMDFAAAHAFIEKVHAASACRGCARVEDYEDTHAILGLYEFAATQPSDYKRRDVPVVPAVVEKSFDSKNAPIVFDKVCFATEELVQPIRWTEVFSYVDSDNIGPRDPDAKPEDEDE